MYSKKPNLLNCRLGFFYFSSLFSNLFQIPVTESIPSNPIQHNSTVSIINGA